MFKQLTAIALVLVLPSPAEAAIVYLKDGTQVQGALAVEEESLRVKPDQGEARSIPYAQVQGVSLDDQPLYPPPHRIASDWGAWAGVAANVVAIGAAIYVATWAIKK